MSTATATRPVTHARAQHTPAPVREVSRHVQIVTTKAQRRARPKVVHAVITLGALFVLFAAQLLLSIAVSDGAYQISALQQTQKELARTENALAERLDALSSPQNLVANAASLGMVIATDAKYLRLADGAVLVAPSLEVRYGCTTMCAFVGNALTKGMSVVKPPTATATGTVVGGTTTQAPAGGASAATPTTPTTPTVPTTPSGPTTDTLPAPVTQ